MSAARSPAESLLLAGSLCLLPFLLPYHQQPVLSFYPEWLAVALGTAAVLAALAGREFPAVSWPVAARFLIAFALLLAFQAAYGGQAYSQPPLLGALYVLYAVLILWLGAQLTSVYGLDRVAGVLAGFLLTGALANALAGVVQFYGRPALLEDVIAELRSSHAYGNIAQANLYANYLALGESALLFLWSRKRVRTVYALPAFALLILGSVLSSSRGAMLYALWFAALGTLAGSVEDGNASRRLKLAAYGLAGASLVAQFAVPWMNAALGLRPPGEGAVERLLASPGEFVELRPRAWLLALRVFLSAPIVGVGIGEFARASFDLGLDPSLTRSGQVWTSPHNLPLQLLAETGMVGAALALGGLSVWGWASARLYCADRRIASWWVGAAVGVEMIHSLTEFPLWNAHFLAVTALLMGVGAAPSLPSARMSRPSRIAAALACAALAAALALALRDYVRIDTTRVTGTTVTLASPADAQRDAATMRGLTHGLMAPLAELQIVTGASLDRSDLAVKLAMSERAARYWPSHVVLVRRAAFLAFSGETEQAQALLARTLQAFPHQFDSAILILEQALAADKAAIDPLLVAARGMRPSPGPR